MARKSAKPPPNRISEFRKKRKLTQTELGDELGGVHWTTVSDLERGVQNLTQDWMMRLAGALDIRAGDLLIDDEDEPRIGTSSVPLGGYIGAGGTIDTSTEQRKAGVSYEVELAIAVPDAVVAYQVNGESMLPVFEPDTVIVCRAHTTDPTPHLGKRVAVGLADGSRQLKVLEPGTEPGRYNLESLNRAASTIRNAEVAWVARIAAIIPVDEWRLLEKNGGSAAFKRAG